MEVAWECTAMQIRPSRKLLACMISNGAISRGTHSIWLVRKLEKKGKGARAQLRDRVKHPDIICMADSHFLIPEMTDEQVLLHRA